MEKYKIAIIGYPKNVHNRELLLSMIKDLSDKSIDLNNKFIEPDFSFINMNENRNKKKIRKK